VPGGVSRARARSFVDDARNSHELDDEGVANEDFVEQQVPRVHGLWQSMKPGTTVICFASKVCVPFPMKGLDVCVAAPPR